MFDTQTSSTLLLPSCFTAEAASAPSTSYLATRSYFLHVTPVALFCSFPSVALSGIFVDDAIGMAFGMAASEGAVGWSHPSASPWPTSTRFCVPGGGRLGGQSVSGTQLRSSPDVHSSHRDLITAAGGSGWRCAGGVCATACIWPVLPQDAFLKATLKLLLGFCCGGNYFTACLTLHGTRWSKSKSLATI